MMASLDAAIGELPAAPMAHQQFLPEPEASHAEVLADKALFERTLKRVQLHFGIDEKVPKLGGRDLDLQELYRNVTSLGGCDQVIASKQWRVRSHILQCFLAPVWQQPLRPSHGFTPCGAGCGQVLQLPRHHHERVLPAAQGVHPSALGLRAGLLFPGAPCQPPSPVFSGYLIA